MRVSYDYICVTSMLLVCGYTEWCDNYPFVVPWFSAGSVLNRVSGSLLSSRALDRGLLSSKTTYSAGGKTAGWRVFNVNIKAGTVAHHSTITISEGTAATESHRQRAAFTNTKRTCRWECSTICRVFQWTADSPRARACVWLHHEPDKQIWYSLEGSFVLWTVTLGIPGPGEIFFTR